MTIVIRRYRHAQREAELLQQINQGLPLPTRQRYAVLHKKLLHETLTSEEHQELGVLSSSMWSDRPI